jgi:protein O-mannosyl-transferase
MAKRSKRKRKGASPRSKPGLVETFRGITWKVILQAAIIVALGIWIYTPSLHGLWLWDDDFLIQHNDDVHNELGLWRIWFEPSTLIDYFPLTVSVEWLEWQIWPNNPFCYHLTSLICHLASALLVWHLFTKLGIRLAWLGALVFTIHPVMVESVAWMAELKNTLAMPPFLVALCLWIDYERTRKVPYYIFAVIFFLIAMLCKTSMVMFPFVILLYAWWKRERLSWTDLLRTIPFFLISLAVGEVFIAYMRHGVGEQFIPLGGPLSRVACAGLSLVFYFSKCILPLKLLPIYPQWVINPPTPLQFLPWPVLGFGFWWLWRRRAKAWARHALLGFGFFFLNLLPVVGFRAISFMRFGWVMDHFLYLPILGLLGLVAAGAGQLDGMLPSSTRAWRIAGLTAVLAILAVGSHRYAKIYVDRLALWTYTTKHNWMAWPAHNNRGNELLDQHRNIEAEEEFKIALQLNPVYTEAHGNLGYVYAKEGKLKEAEAQFREALKYTPDFESAQRNLRVVLQAEAAASKK